MRERRHEFGLSVSETAGQAGMDSGYLEEAAASVSRSALLRLAAALDTTAEALAGGGIERAPGAGPAGRSPVLEELGPEECERLLSGGGVGRVVAVSERGPGALPVNFRLLDGDIVFRTAEGGLIDRVIGAKGGEIGFEVDQMDEALAEGWSVMVRGRARPVAGEAELARVRGLGVEPWAGGKRDRYLRLTPAEVTGRRIRVRA